MKNTIFKKSLSIQIKRDFYCLDNVIRSDMETVKKMVFNIQEGIWIQFFHVKKE